MRKFLMALCFVAVVGVMVGCEEVGTEKIDLGQSVAAVKAKAANMDVAELKAMALKYKQAMKDKQVEVNKVMSEIGKVDLSAAGKKVDKVKVDIDEIMKSVGTLKKHYDVYLGKLKELGADISDVKL